MKRTIFIIAIVICTMGAYYYFNTKSAQKTIPVCTKIHVSKFPIITYGFEYSEFDTVLIRTFVKGSNYENKVDEFSCFLRDDMSDSLRKERYFEVPSSLLTSYDWQIIIGDTLIYNIDSIKLSVRTTSSMISKSDECQISSYRVNGKTFESGNIVIDR